MRFQAGIFLYGYLLAPGFAIFSRGHAYNGIEYYLEIVGVVVAAAKRDFGDGIVRIDEQILGFADTAVNHILDGGIAQDLFKGMG